MAKKYLEKLSSLLEELTLEDETSLPMEIKHFFSGAALLVLGAALLVLSVFIVSCEPRNTELGPLTELPAELAPQLEYSTTDPILITQPQSLTATGQSQPTTAVSTRAQQCSWNYLSKVSYPIVRCYPQNSLMPDIQLVTETQHYKLTQFRGKQLASPFLCSVRSGPWSAQVTETEACNANVPNEFKLLAATPRVKIDWSGHWEDIPQHESLNVFMDDLYILREGCACCEGFSWCANTGSCIDRSLDCNSLPRQ